MPDVYVSGKKAAAKAASPSSWSRDVIQKVLTDTGERPRKAVLGSFCVYPGAKFITQQEDEEILLLLRAHPITNLGWILITLGMVLLPSVLLASGVFTDVPGRFVFVGQLVWYLMTFVYAFERFLYWYYSVFIITNERLVDIDFTNLLWREVTYANLNHIEEPEMVTGGFFRSLLQYGDVNITTASKEPSVEALGVPYPDRAIDMISRVSEELEKRRERGE